MSQVLQLVVPDPLYKAIECQAAAQGSSAATVAVSALEQHFQTTDKTMHPTGIGTLEALFGAADGPATGLDNEAIDADLAREYARGLPK